MLIAVVLIVLAIVGAVALQIDDWSRDLTTNRAETNPETNAETNINASDLTLRSLELPATIEEVREAIARFVGRSGAWTFGEKIGDEDASDADKVVVIRLVRTSRLFRFADDVRVFLQPIESGTRVDVVSQSRVGKGDLGQNPRNIRTLLQSLRDASVALGVTRQTLVKSESRPTSSKKNRPL